MTNPKEDLLRERKTVVVFDICSSTTILEDLKESDNQQQWRNLLIGLKNFLVEEREGYVPFDLYKFACGLCESSSMRVVTNRRYMT
ncbi:MAG: hypothetical protein DMG61_21905 [Acidobacteria bacterium]|nr:MAG: hypothetical protein DMG64_14420 [Acidobacteriota bacterium]PYY10404.1 MAG: hypothetical protein DMG61_21905 [Acidobacteriota bacterium]PYY19812.1 MAG: hypothetical protein DMG60_02880 [Acidobacteriota bacterium]PYY22793.1 MAG: hypothetical protein DMG62_11520 [Acidobacteriota bacterium]HEU0047518.1 hypothetical protein [Nitrososphaera sp.]